MKPQLIKAIFIFFVALMPVACASAAKDDDNSGERVGLQGQSGLLQRTDNGGRPEGDLSDEMQVGDDLPVSRGMAAKMMMLALNDQQAIDGLEREISFEDTDLSKWYDRYVNAAVIQGIMIGIDGKFMPEAPLTLQQAQVLLDKLDSGNTVKLQLDEAEGDAPVSYALWTELFCRVIKSAEEEGKAFGIEEKNIIVLATPDNNKSLPHWNMITDSGPLSYRGLSMEAYIDKEIRALIKDGEVVGICSVVSHSPTIKNAFVVRSDKNSITVFTGGAERTYLWDNDRQDMAGVVCDIRIQGSRGLEVVLYEERISGVIKKTSDEMIELAETGTLLLDENFKIYSVADGPVKWKSLRDLPVGTDSGEFFIRAGETLSAVILRLPTPAILRVAINNTGFTSLIHEGISLTCTSDYTVKAGDALASYAKGEVLNISKEENSDLFGQSRITVAPLSEEGRIQIKSIKRAWEGDESPLYRGIFEISKEEGGYVLVNEIGLEEYLYAVVPSEMPSSYGVEASKVQAVTARSYAYNQFYANRYHRYGANIDDSVSCQVYNNIPENSVSIQAVNETAGTFLAYGGQVISANFFSTSAGATAGSGEVWANYATKEFPTESSPYSISKKQYKDADFGDLSKEENAAVFFKATEIDCYDSDAAWFRWNVEMTAEEIGASVNANLAGRYAANPALIKTLQPDGVYRSRSIESIGELIDMEVTRRGSGGNIMEMKITGSEAVIMVSTEYNVRSLVRPVAYGGGSVLLHRKDGSSIENYSLMPSAFYVLEKAYIGEEELPGFTFYGGGNGHGAGMSQNGAKGMADRGFTLEEILEHYYPGTEMKKILS